MRIDQLELLRYGKFEGQRLAFPHAERDIHIIVGPNEAGKSTVRAAVSELLYGIERSSPQAFRHRQDTRIGARIAHAGHTLDFHRAKGLRTTLRTPADEVLPDDALAAFVGASDRQSFADMFGLDHARLVAGGTSILDGTNDIGKILFEAASGVANLGAVQKALDEEANGLWDMRKSQSRAYYVAAAQMDQASAALRDAVVRTKDWSAAQSKVAASQLAHDTARERHAQLKLQRERLQRVRRVAPQLEIQARVRQRLVDLGEVPELPADALMVVDKAEAALAGAEATLAEQNALAQAAQIALNATPVDQRVRDRADDIINLDHRRIQYQAYETDIAQRQAEIDGHWDAVARSATQLGWGHLDEAALQARLPHGMQRKALLRLIREHDGLRQAHATAEQALRDQQLKAAQIDQALAALGKDAFPAELAAALAQAQKLGDLDTVGAQRALTVRQKRQALGTTTLELGKWPVEVQALRAMTPPLPEFLQSLQQAQLADEAETKAARRRQQVLKDAAQAQQLALDQFEEAHHPTTRAQVLAARHGRDALWALILAAPDGLLVRAPTYAESVLGADTLADQHHEKIQQASELQALQLQFARNALDLSQVTAQLQQLDDSVARRAELWQRTAQECGLPALPFHAASAWLAARQRLLAAADALGAAELELTAHLEAIEAARARLATALTHHGHEAAAQSLPVLVVQAGSLQSAVDTAHGQRMLLNEQQLRASQLAVTLAAASTQAEKALKRWDVRWEAATAAAAATDWAQASDLGAVEGVLELIEAIDAGLAAIRTLRVTRVAAMRADLEAHAQAAKTLAQQLAPLLLGLPPADIAVQLRAQLNVAEESAKEAERLRGAQAAATTKGQAASDLLQRSQAALAPLLSRSNAATMPELRTAIERSDEARGLRQAMALAEQALRDTSDGLTLGSLQAEADAVDKTALLSDLEELARQETLLLNDLSSVAAQRQAETTLLEAMAGGADAARAEGQRQEALADMATAVERYVTVRTASRLLKWSIDRYRDDKQAPMLAVASRIFAALTLGSFERLSVDYDSKSPKLQGRRKDGEQIDIEGLSDGTRDQLYLALRLAALDMHLDRAHALPFIADDLFINYDDQRSRAGLQALGELSRKTQVIFLTHHDHLVPTVEAVLGQDVNVVRL